MSLLFGLLFFFQSASAQQPRSLANRSTTRAVVIGISSYQHIDSLSFAHVDAQAFAGFLTSKSGGNVPEANIRMLLNEQATQGNMAAAMDWLLEESESGDKAVIFFAGHGDMETKTMMQHGFLLAHDAPPTTYMAGGTFPVFYLQSIISTLSTQKNVEVMMFSDACRAGKLAGSSIGGPQATAQILAAQFANEVKVLSCQPNEFSLEGTQWGGGRGVFSYYLIQGLEGLADQEGRGNGDGKVTLLEIEDYLEEKVPPQTAPYSQIPMTVGNKGRDLFRVDRARLEALKMEGVTEGEPLAMRGIESRGLEELAFAETDSSLLPVYLRFESAIEEGKLLGDDDDNAYALYQRLSTEESLEPLHGLMRRRLAAALQDDTQQAVNAYLLTPAEELRRRWDYDERYGIYPEYLEKAAELLGPAHAMYDHLRARQLYFEGLNLRLQAERQNDDALFAKALEKQRKVLELIEDAAFANNEIGLIYLHRPEADLKEAEKYFEKANEQSPAWPLPLLNLSALANRQQQYQEAEEIGLRLLALDANFAPAYNNLGNTYNQTDRFGEAEAMYRKAIELQDDPDYWFNLGGALLAQEKYSETENWLKRYQKERPEDPDGPYQLGRLFSFQKEYKKAEKWYARALEADPDYSIVYYRQGWLYLVNMRELEKAETAYLNYLRYDPGNTIAYYNLACAASLGGRTEKAAGYLEQAMQHGWDDYGQIAADGDLSALRETAVYQQLMDKYFPDR